MTILQYVSHVWDVNFSYMEKQNSSLTDHRDQSTWKGTLRVQHSANSQRKYLLVEPWFHLPSVGLTAMLMVCGWGARIILTIILGQCCSKMNWLTQVIHSLMWIRANDLATKNWFIWMSSTSIISVQLFHGWHILLELYTRKCIPLETRVFLWNNLEQWASGEVRSPKWYADEVGKHSISARRVIWQLFHQLEFMALETNSWDAGGKAFFNDPTPGRTASCDETLSDREFSSSLLDTNHSKMIPHFFHSLGIACC